MRYAKWLGGSLGWAFGGPIGAIIGFVLGSALDQAGTQKGRTGNYGGGPTQSGDFTLSLLILSAAVMKADGKMLRSELDYVKAFLTHNFGAAKTVEMMHALKEILKKDIPIQEVCEQIRRFMPAAGRLQLLHFLYGISRADGEVHPREVEVIEQIAGYLGINPADGKSVRATYYHDISHDYQVLEITSSATDEEVKKAYRRMAVKFHPDKVDGMGEEVKKGAKEKFQRLQEAYERICKTRGIK